MDVGNGYGIGLDAWGYYWDRFECGGWSGVGGGGSGLSCDEVGGVGCCFGRHSAWCTKDFIVIGWKFDGSCVFVFDDRLGVARICIFGRSWAIIGCGNRGGLIRHSFGSRGFGSRTGNRTCRRI